METAMLWDQVAEERELMNTLSRLGRSAKLSFALACIEHLLRMKSVWPEEAGLEIREISRVTQLLWQCTETREAVDTSKLISGLELLLPSDYDDEVGLPAGVGDVIEAAMAACLLVLANDPKVDDVAGVASICYQSVAEVFVLRCARPAIEHEMDELEKSTPQCVDEIEFQFRYLDSVSQVNGGSYLYDAVVRVL
jgi:hypothetical protein